MSLFNFGKNKIVNLIIKDHVIRFVELKQPGDLIVHNWGERYLPAGLIHEGVIQDIETLSMILEECIQDWKIAKKQVRFLVPDSSVVIRRLPIPEDVHADEIKGYLYMELGTSIHLPFEDPVFDYYLLKEQENKKKQILLFAAPEQNVSAYAELLEDVKLSPVAADISAIALYRYYVKTSEVATDDVAMLVQIDLKTVNVSIFEQHYPLFMRHLPMEVDEAKWEISRTQGDIDEFYYRGDNSEVFNGLEDIYKELDKVLSFYRYTLNKGEKQVNKMVFAGDHPWLSNIVEQMKDRFDYPVISLSSKSVLNEVPIPTSMLVNIGLGLKEV
ncbi:type IV pilus biogenesis protein PilM [Niallia sp. 03133]|uniref:type IV pilus biogenesis protein PilM n=1 Tax=Niallia sp. 03133 TaxID=3458060 RepID=UPI004043A6E3